MLTRRSVRTFAGSIAAASILSACTGANPAGGLLPGAKPALATPASRPGKTTVEIGLKIPRKGVHHGAHYISESTGSVTVAVYDSTHKHLYSQFTADTVPGFGGCTPVTAGSFTCTFAMVAPAGIDTVDVTTFDNTNGQGVKLSLVTDYTIKVKSGKANVLPMVLGGIPSLTDVSLHGTSPLAYDDQIGGLMTFAGVGPAYAQVIQVIAEDGDQNTIVGPGSPTYGLQSNDPADVTIAPVAGSPGLFKVTPLHTTTVPITLTAGSTPLYGNSGTVFAQQHLQISPIVYVANNGNNTIAEYSSWSTSPILTIPTASGLVNPDTMTLDSAGNLWVANLALAGSVLEFAPGATVATRTIPVEAPDVGLAVDSAGDVFVTEAIGTIDVKEFTPSGGSTPSRTLSKTTSPAGINTPAGLALDASGNLFVANNGGTIGVSEYAPGSSTTPVAAFNAGTNKPYGIAFDATGNLYVANYGGNNVTEYQPPFSNATAVHQTFGSAATASKAQSLALDSLGNLYVGLGTGTWVEFNSGTAVVRTLPGIGSVIPSIAVDKSNNVYVPSDSSNAVGIWAPGSSTSTSGAYVTGVNDPVEVVAWP